MLLSFSFIHLIVTKWAWWASNSFILYVVLALCYMKAIGAVVLLFFKRATKDNWRGPLLLICLKNFYFYWLLILSQKEDILFFLMIACTIHMLSVINKIWVLIIPFDIRHIYKSYLFLRELISWSLRTILPFSQTSKLQFVDFLCHKLLSH